MIKEFPLIAVTEVFDMPSVDNDLSWREGDDKLGKTEDILANKLNDVIDWDYGWTVDTEFEYPIHIHTHAAPTDRPYGSTLPDKYVGTRIMGNGHHRLAFQAWCQGALFVHYCEDKYESGW